MEFPVFDAQSRSIKRDIIGGLVGGRIAGSATSRPVVRSLNNIDIDIRAGERVGLMGHNGAGKSTLLRVMCGVYEPTRGHAVIEGKVASLVDISLGMDNESTGMENIFIRGVLTGFSRKFIKSHLDEIVEFSGLGKFIDLPVKTYSSGMSLRLAFSIATAMTPDILVMDEWLSVGDEGFQRKAEERMHSLVAGADIMVMASHSIQTIRKTCNRLIRLEHGSVVEDSRIDMPAG